MTLRHIALTVAAFAVLGLAVYLFFEVRAAPATTVPLTRAPVATTGPERDTPEPPPIQRDTVAAPVRDVVRAPAVTQSNSDTPIHTPTLANPEDAGRLDAIMAEANKAYDRAEYDEARQIAARVLAKEPTNVRMLRIMVSAACIDGDAADAQKHYAMLPSGDKAQMKTRCDRYGITFPP